MNFFRNAVLKRELISIKFFIRVEERILQNCLVRLVCIFPEVLQMVINIKKFPFILNFGKNILN